MHTPAELEKWKLSGFWRSENNFSYQINIVSLESTRNVSVWKIKVFSLGFWRHKIDFSSVKWNRDIKQKHSLFKKYYKKRKYLDCLHCKINIILNSTYTVKSNICRIVTTTKIDFCTSDDRVCLLCSNSIYVDCTQVNF